MEQEKKYKRRVRYAGTHPRMYQEKSEEGKKRYAV